MRKYQYVEVRKKVLVEWKCSVCGLDLLDNDMEGQEALNITKTGGYYSVFGDGTEIQIDFCQHCFKKLLGEYCTLI